VSLIVIARVSFDRCAAKSLIHETTNVAET
jgi:hypothetical protein